jgi:hypothetical protein
VSVTSYQLTVICIEIRAEQKGSTRGGRDDPHPRRTAGLGRLGRSSVTSSDQSNNFGVDAIKLDQSFDIVPTPHAKYWFGVPPRFFLPVFPQGANRIDEAILRPRSGQRQSRA